MAEMMMEDTGRQQGAARTADSSGTSLVGQYSIDAAILDKSHQWVGKYAMKKGKNTDGHLVDINRDVFELLQISRGRDEDYLELQAFMDIFNPEMLLFDTKNFNANVPHLTQQELSARQKLMDQHLTFDLPEIYNPTFKKIRPFELTPAERRNAQIVMRRQEETVLDAYNSASATEVRQVLGDAYEFCGFVNALIIDPTLLDGVYEDLFCAFCKLANVNLSRGNSYQKKATVLGKEVTAIPDFRIQRKECFVRKPTPYSRHPGVVAVVEVNDKCQWDSNYELRKDVRPKGYGYTCNMRGQLLGDMLLHLDISSCIAKPNDVEPGSDDTFAVIGISVVTTKVSYASV